MSGLPFLLDGGPIPGDSMVFMEEPFRAEFRLENASPGDRHRVEMWRDISRPSWAWLYLRLDPVPVVRECVWSREMVVIDVRYPGWMAQLVDAADYDARSRVDWP